MIAPSGKDAGGGVVLSSPVFAAPVDQAYDRAKLPLPSRARWITGD